MCHLPDHTSDECGFCSTIVFDPNQTSDPLTGRHLNSKYQRVAIFLGPALDSILAAEASCPLAKWLVAQFQLSRNLEATESWDAVCARGNTIKLCFGQIYRERDQYGRFYLIGSSVDKVGDYIRISNTSSVRYFAQEGNHQAF